ncbi:peptidoglycan-binding protein [Candidatus Kaiserbacteria bacterium]|nr:peptidoglycan-binding protein [Candidatus Kaiserbacteria bacterium]
MNRILRNSVIALALGLAFVPAFSFAATLTQNLSIGSSGDEVTALQTFLAVDPTIYPEGLVTGYYGSLTAAAVTRFQAKYAIDQVGSVGPITRAKINDLLASGGFGPSGVFGDISAPIMSPQAVTTGSNSATITWTTSEQSRNRVMYATYWPFLYASAQSVTDASSPSASASVTLSGLTPNTLYYFVPESVDASGNIMWTIEQTFRTKP